MLPVWDRISCPLPFIIFSLSMAGLGPATQKNADARLAGRLLAGIRIIETEPMTLEPLLHAPLAVQIHVATVIPAFVIGTWQSFLSRKGAPAHRAWGYLYLVLITITAIAALFIHAVMPKSPFSGLIHIISSCRLRCSAWQARFAAPGRTTFAPIAAPCSAPISAAF